MALESELQERTLSHNQFTSIESLAPSRHTDEISHPSVYHGHVENSEPQNGATKVEDGYLHGLRFALVLIALFLAIFCMALVS